MHKEIIGIIGHTEEKMTLRKAMAKMNENTTKTNINTKDIYPHVGVSLMARDYYEATLEEKSVMVEEELKRYIAHKLAYCGYFISDKEAIHTEISELLTKLYELTGKDKEIVYQIIHYVLGLFTEVQGYQAIWLVEEDESYIVNPVLEEKEGTLDKLITHMDTEPITTFNLVFEYYLTKCNQKHLIRTRKKEELPKNGE